MKIRLRTNLGSREFPDHPLKAGDVCDVPQKLGELLVARKLADEVKEIKAVPPPPEIMGQTAATTSRRKN